MLTDEEIQKETKKCLQLFALNVILGILVVFVVHYVIRDKLLVVDISALSMTEFMIGTVILIGCLSILFVVHSLMYITWYLLDKAEKDLNNRKPPGDN